ncbi:unnamed protein product [Vitrella brassicaformis CCMP3155]|uniref:Methylthioribose-1-phosphate isomerase n=1 Tax=Vitrella brassicaformis (strain CCMP3155) TaxID=1169540 RepID=A0A0G4FJB9_VITBC|nr:unnamed protein product [Vitrella brassicaformis CCMP3155]|eukprot:CEM13172.1 unnamed protein product [Vitrella brassicaformis CCMP3155]
MNGKGEDEVFTMKWIQKGDSARLQLLDQSDLPASVSYVDLHNAKEVAESIRSMKVRGAPAIGCAAAYGMALECLLIAKEEPSVSGSTLKDKLQDTKKAMDEARPTAVNLMYATARIVEVVDTILNIREDASAALISECIVDEAQRIFNEDVENNKRLGSHGVATIDQDVAPMRASKAAKTEGATATNGPAERLNLIHHCNTGALATAGHGTALGVIFSLSQAGKNLHVYVDETRPRLQGAKLTCWELRESRIPHHLIVDGASGLLMYQGKVDAVVFGADRVAANGDVANKIGTFNLAMAAHAHGIPVYACVPTSTIDLTIPTGQDIVIEERSSDEILRVSGGASIAPDGTQVFNPAFDVTPARFLTGIITEEGTLKPPFGANLKEAKEKALQREKDNRQKSLLAIQQKLSAK